VSLDESALRNYLEKLSTADEPDDIWSAVFDFLHVLDFEKISYHVIPTFSTGGAIDMTVATDGFSDEWLCHYIEDQLHLVDPIPAFALQSTKPFLWSEIESLTELTKPEKSYIEEMMDFEACNGLAVQVFGPSGLNGYFGLAFTQKSRVIDPLDLHEIQWVCQLAHHRYCDFVKAVSADVTLSAREREVLEWVAKGKSNSAIAKIIGVSIHSVDAYMRRIYAKLGVNERVTAAIRGLGSGLIHGSA